MRSNLVAADTLTSGLNLDQKQAVTLGWGPSLILAGAGSGKTTVLMRRIAYLFSELQQDPYAILAVTFTNKAASQMKSRLESLLGNNFVKQLWIGTFHSICARILRREIESYETPEGWIWKNNFAIYDETDSLNIVKTVITRLNLDEKIFAPREIRHTISALKNDGKQAYKFAESVKGYRETRIAEYFMPTRQNLPKITRLILMI